MFSVSTIFSVNNCRNISFKFLAFQKYITMLDPIQLKLGNRMGAMLYLPALSGDIFYCASILAALGKITIADNIHRRINLCCISFSGAVDFLI